MMTTDKLGRVFSHPPRPFLSLLGERMGLARLPCARPRRRAEASRQPSRPHSLAITLAEDAITGSARDRVALIAHTVLRPLH